MLTACWARIATKSLSRRTSSSRLRDTVKRFGASMGKGAKKRRQDDRGWDEDHPKGIHAGSYATEEHRKLFGVELPSFLLDSEPEEALEREDGGEKRVKRKVAFLLAYLGTRYGGMQMNEKQRTLQSEFELALALCHMLGQRNFGTPSKYGWSTSGRTDKGVHACAQVCSAKILVLPSQTMDEIRQEINAKLPPDFQCLDVVRTTKGFCAHTQRDRVRYQYMIPSFALMDVATTRAHFMAIGAHPKDRDGRDPLSKEEIAAFQQRVKSFRVSEEQLGKLSETLKLYEGTHKFHNYSRRVSGTETRASRYILSFQAETPVVVNDVEWIPTQVLGQSFLLNQIRKMVCMAMEVTRGATGQDTLVNAFDPEVDIAICLAPANGLYLDMSFYEGYNRRKQTNGELLDLNWATEGTKAHERWKKFRDEKVMKHVIVEEETEGNFVKYLFLQDFVFDRNNYTPQVKEENGEHES